MADLKYELAKQDDLNSNESKPAEVMINNHETKKRLPPRQKTYAIVIIAVLAFVAFLFLVGLIVLGVQVSNLKKTIEDMDASAPCTTVDCINTVSDLMSAVDPSVDPCEDFSQYACGKWQQRNPMPDKDDYWAPLVKLRASNEQTIQRLIKRTNTRIRYSQNEALRKVFTFYDACMDQDSMDSIGSKPLLDLIEELGSSPGFNASWNETSWDLNDVVTRMQRDFPTPVFFQLWISVLEKNTSVHVIMMSYESVGLRISRYNSTKEQDVKVKKAYKQYMVSLLKLLGLSENKSVEMMQSVFSVEFDLSTMVPSMSAGKVMKIKELGMDSQQLNWTLFFQNLFRETSYKPNANTTIKLYGGDYFQRLNKYLFEKPKGDLANYVVWRLIARFSSLLAKRYRQPWNEYLKVYRSDVQSIRWERCVAEVKSHFGMAIGRMFVDEVFRNGSKLEASELVDDIKKLFIEDFDEVEWMDEETKVAAKEKAAALHGNIGYPKFIMDDQKLAALYKQVTVKNDTYFANALSIEKLSLLKFLRDMDRVPDRKHWVIYPTTINAAYSPTTNTMDIPAGILQKPLFHNTYPGSVNFGAIGAIIGHEMTHGFDTMGKKFNQHGHSQKWWTNASIENFNEKSKCFVDQYSNFTYMGMQLDGKVVLGEVIADNGGTEIAFKAYKLWVKEHGKERQLPGIKLSHEQIFFIAYAQIFCSAYAKDAMKYAMRSVHPINPLRIRGVMINSKEFAKAFKCPVGSPMNPAKKCKVW